HGLTWIASPDAGGTPPAALLRSCRISHAAEARYRTATKNGPGAAGQRWANRSSAQSRALASAVATTSPASTRLDLTATRISSVTARATSGVPVYRAKPSVPALTDTPLTPTAVRKTCGAKILASPAAAMRTAPNTTTMSTSRATLTDPPFAWASEFPEPLVGAVSVSCRATPGPPSPIPVAMTNLLQSVNRTG